MDIVAEVPTRKVTVTGVIHRVCSCGQSWPAHTLKAGGEGTKVDPRACARYAGAVEDFLLLGGVEAEAGLASVVAAALAAAPAPVHRAGLVHPRRDGRQPYPAAVWRSQGIVGHQTNPTGGGSNKTSRRVSGSSQ